MWFSGSVEGQHAFFVLIPPPTKRKPKERQALCIVLTTIFSCRTCPGRYLAEETLFISMVTTLSAFDIMGVNGQMPKYEFDDGFIRYVGQSIAFL